MSIIIHIIVKCIHSEHQLQVCYIIHVHVVMLNIHVYMVNNYYFITITHSCEFKLVEWNLIVVSFSACKLLSAFAASWLEGGS